MCAPFSPNVSLYRYKSTRCTENWRQRKSESVALMCVLLLIIMLYIMPIIDRHEPYAFCNEDKDEETHIFV